MVNNSMSFYLHLTIEDQAKRLTLSWDLGVYKCNTNNCVFESLKQRMRRGLGPLEDAMSANKGTDTTERNKNE